MAAFRSIAALIAGLLTAGSAAAAPAPPPPLAVASPAPPPVSQRTVPRITLSDDGSTVSIVGPLLEDSFLRFDALLQRAPKVKQVYLASSGGLTLEGRLIAALVRKRGLDTYVETYCASACTQVFVAGRQRVIGPEAELGFHQAIGIDEKGETAALGAASNRPLTALTVFGINGNDTLRLAYERAGIDPTFIAKALAHGHDDMWLPGADELAAAKVITRRAASPDQLPPNATRSRQEIAAEVSNNPMWRAARTALPEAYAAGVADAWRRANTGSDLKSAVASGRGEVVLAAWPLLAKASDDLLQRMLALYARSAQLQRATGYPMCRETPGKTSAPTTALDASFEESEDQLLVELFAASERGNVLSEKDARKIFERDVAPLMLQNYLITDPNSSTASCRLGFRIFETIGAMPEGKRVNAYRSLLSLPQPPAS